MNKERRLVSIWLLVSFIFFVVVDIILFIRGNDATISIVVWVNSFFSTKALIPLLMGWMIGHFFSPPVPRNEIK